MSQSMSMAEFRALVAHINADHSPLKLNRVGKTVKYIDSHFSALTESFFSITFRGFSWEKTFSVVNEGRDIKESLFERCMEFLDTPDCTDYIQAQIDAKAAIAKADGDVVAEYEPIDENDPSSYSVAATIKPTSSEVLATVLLELVEYVTINDDSPPWHLIEKAKFVVAKI